MGLLKLVFKVSLAGVVVVATLAVVGLVRQHLAEVGGARVPLAAGRPKGGTGFVLLSKNDAANDKVIIMCAAHCPRAESVRARDLGQALGVIDIPYELKSDISFSFHRADEMARVQQFMANVTNPLVLIRGRAKGNPTFEEVVEEYRYGK